MGALHGSWCWQKLTPLPEAEGHRVDPLDLPGHGNNLASISGMTLQTYAEHVRERVETADGPVILVGHSMGVMVITQAAELVRGRIATLVYLAAFLPRNGQAIPQLAEGDAKSLVRPNMIVNEEEGFCVVAEQVRRDAFSVTLACSALLRLLFYSMNLYDFG
jgi:pimeloyl-ACP methyl ester carboxylesterase